MNDLIAYFGAQNEKLSLAVHEDLLERSSATTVKPPAYTHIAMTDEEANTRKLTSLIENVSTMCDEYLQATHNPIRDEISVMFGNDNHTGSVLHEIFEKLNDYNCENQPSFDGTNLVCMATSSQHVFNLQFRDCCVRCSGIPVRHNTEIYKKFMNFQRSIYSKQALLTFGTRHSGVCIQVVVTSPCSLCNKAESTTTTTVESLLIRTIPCIEEKYIQRDELLDNPIAFIEKSLWRWVDEYR